MSKKLCDLKEQHLEISSSWQLQPFRLRGSSAEQQKVPKSMGKMWPSCDPKFLWDHWTKWNPKCCWLINYYVFFYPSSRGHLRGGAETSKKCPAETAETSRFLTDVQVVEYACWHRKFIVKDSLKSSWVHVFWIRLLFQKCNIYTYIYILIYIYPKNLKPVDKWSSSHRHTLLTAMDHRFAWTTTPDLWCWPWEVNLSRNQWGFGCRYDDDDGIDLHWIAG